MFRGGDGTRIHVDAMGIGFNKLELPIIYYTEHYHCFKKSPIGSRSGRDLEVGLSPLQACFPYPHWAMFDLKLKAMLFAKIVLNILSVHV